MSGNSGEGPFVLQVQEIQFERTLMKLFLSTVFLLAGIALAQDTLHVDAVELIGGREVNGLQQYSVRHAGYIYLFVNAANRETFADDPGRYEIQLGGACARMGPLSGRGRTDLFTVLDGKIYIFASESCRTTFLAGPERVLDSPDSPPVVTSEAREKGKALLAKALLALGGETAVDGVISYQEVVEKESEYQGRNVRVGKSFTLLFPEAVRVDDRWDIHQWTMLHSPDASFFLSSDGRREMVESQRAAMVKEMTHNVVYLLRQRNRPDFVCAAAGEGMAGAKSVELLLVHVNGLSQILGISPRSGRILSQKYRERGPAMFLGEAEFHFSDFIRVGELILPSTVSALFDGKIVPEWSKTFNTIDLNREEHRQLFD
jgi:YHS domain-containing protein